MLYRPSQSGARYRQRRARVGPGLYPLFTGANEQGARDAGCVPNFLPGHRAVETERHRQRFAAAWSAEIPETPGTGVRDVPAAIRSGDIEALHVVGDSPTYTSGEVPRFIEAMNDAEFVVVHANFTSAVTDAADVVLPALTFAERRGTYTNLERRVQLLRPALGPKGDEDADWRVIANIARRMGGDGFEYTDEERIFDEMNNLVRAYGGITYGRLEAGGLQWPCLAADMGDTPILYEDTLDTRKPKLAPMTLVDSPAQDNDDYPLTLARGRVLHQPEEDIEIIQIDGKNAIKRDESIQLHPADAAELGIGGRRLDRSAVAAWQSRRNRRPKRPPARLGIHNHPVRRLGDIPSPKPPPGPDAERSDAAANPRPTGKARRRPRRRNRPRRRRRLALKQTTIPRPRVPIPSPLMGEG